jgi:hypothetical protein
MNFINFKHKNDITLDVLNKLDKPDDNFVHECINYDNIELLQSYIIKFNNNDSLLSNYLMFRFYVCKQTDMINMLIKNNINIQCDLDQIKDIVQLRKCLEYCRENNYKYVYTNLLLDNIFKYNWMVEHNFIVHNKMEGNIVEYIEEIYKEFNLEYKISHDCVDYASIKYINWLYNKYKLGYIKFEYSNYAIKNAIITNSVELLKWWIDHSDEFELKYEDLIFYNTKIETLNFLLYEQDVIKIEITPEIFITNFICFINNQDKENTYEILDFVYDYLIKNNYDINLDLENVYISSVNILNWLYDKWKLDQVKLKYTKNNFIYNISGNDFDCIKWWFNHIDDFDIDIVIDENDYILPNYDIRDKIFIYIDELSIEMIKFLYFEQKIIKMNIYPKMIDILFNTNKLDTIDFFYNIKHEYNFEYTSDAIDNCNHTYAMKWWLAHMNELELKYTSKSIDKILNQSDDDLIMTESDWSNSHSQSHDIKSKYLKWWCDNRLVIQPKFTKDLLIKYIHDNPDEQYLSVLLD